MVVFDEGINFLVPICLWFGLYRGNPGLIVNGMNLQDLFTYTFLTLILDVISRTELTWILRRGIRSGDLAIEFLCPCPVPVSLISSDVGIVMVEIPSLLFIVLIATPFLRPVAPASVWSFVGFIFSAIMAMILKRIIAILLGTIAFWTLEGGGLIMSASLIIDVLSGGLLPLAFYPHAFRDVLSVLPFQGLVNLPIEIYLGKVQGNQMWLSLLGQGVWTLVFVGIAALVWRTATKRFVVQGG